MSRNRITENSPVRPMRAVSVKDPDKSKVKLPQWISPKIDGWRAIVKNQQVLSNDMRPINNRYVQQQLGRSEFEGFDGELFVRDGFNLVTSAFNSFETIPEDFEFHVFDTWNMGLASFEDRYTWLQMQEVLLGTRPHIHYIEQQLCYTWDEIDELEILYLEQGYEGICGRWAHAPYKYGRGTLNDGCLFKRKPFEDAEGQIIGFEEQMENTNDLVERGTGLTKRTTHQAGKVPKNTLGKVICDTKEFGEIKIGTGTGLDEKLRKFIWDNQDLFRNQFVTFKFQRIGTLNKPRIGVLDEATCFEFHRLRLAADMAIGD